MQRKKSSITSKQPQSMNKPTLEELKQMLQNQLPQLREEYSIRDIWLFGSYARGEQHNEAISMCWWSLMKFLLFL
jgi:hypothetical protein